MSNIIDNLQNNLIIAQPSPYYNNYPLSMELLDNVDEAKLFISEKPSGTEGQIKLNIKNEWNHDIYLASVGHNTTASDNNHHFALSFKPGVLSGYSLKPNNLQLITGAAGSANGDWAIGLKKEGYWETLYLLRKATTGVNRYALKSKDIVKLLLGGLTAEQVGGSRSSRVQLRTNPNMVSFDKAGKKGLQESIGYNFEIVSHLGKQNIPLHAGFVGTFGNRVLNDSTTQTTLNLRLINLSTVRTGIDLNGSTLTLTFDNPASPGVNSEITLVSAKINNAIEMKPPAGGEGKGHALAHQFTSSQKLDHFGTATDHLDIALVVKSDGKAGLANLYVEYKNVGGYWDGKLVCQVEKTPLMIFNQHVGIGVERPSHELEVKGAAKVNSLAISSTTGAGNAISITDWGHGTPSYLTLTGEKTKNLGAERRVMIAAENLLISAAGGNGGSVNKKSVVEIDGTLIVQSWPTGNQNYKTLLSVKDDVVTISTPNTQISGATTVSGALTLKKGLTVHSTDATAIYGPLTVQGITKFNNAVKIFDKHFLEFGAGVAGKEGSAGKIGYELFTTGALDIVGAGPKAQPNKSSPRKIKLWAEGGVTVNGPLLIEGKQALEFGYDIGNKEASAGKVGYDLFKSNALDIVGAGTKVANRKIKLWAEGGLTLNDSTPINRIIAGSVDKDGKITNNSSGFSVTKSGNAYTLKWDVAFKGNNPIVMATIDHESGNGADNNASVSVTSLTKCTVYTWSAEDSEDAGFHFIAIGR